jgi:hypothetical protein
MPAAVRRLARRRATTWQVGLLDLSMVAGRQKQKLAAAAATRRVRRQGAGEVAAELHDWLAAYLWAGGGADALAAASAHWAHGRDAAAFAAALATAARRGEPGEEDMFVARAVLQARPPFRACAAPSRAYARCSVDCHGALHRPAPRLCG